MMNGRDCVFGLGTSGCFAGVKAADTYGQNGLSFEMRRKWGNLQLFQRRLNIWKFEKDGLVRNTLVIEHEADAPDCGGEADILD